MQQLAEANAIFRPGPLELGVADSYIEIKSGKGHEWDEVETIFRKILTEEFGDSHNGLVIFQEDIMKICEVGAGFSLAEADHVRKAMARKDPLKMKEWGEKFAKDWKLNGDPVEMWRRLSGFGSYAFNKSHALAYSIVAYQTAHVWTHNRNQFLENVMARDGKERRDQAFDKCRELGMSPAYPTMENMMHDTPKINNNKIILPGGARENYTSYVDFLFGDEPNKWNLIYKGVCDKLTNDRYALVDLVSTLLPKLYDKAKFMEYDEPRRTLTSILDGLIECEAVVSYENVKGNIEVRVKRGRGEPSLVTFHRNGSNKVRLDMVKYDTKYFGSPRPGIIDSLPYINTTGIEKTIKNLKKTLYDRGLEEKEVFRILQDKLKEYMREHYSTPFSRVFHDVYAIIDDHVSYSNSTKLIVAFSDVKEILYIRGHLENKVRAMKNKKPLVKMTLEYSPFIRRRGQIFVYDFDIIEMEEVLN